MEREIILDNVYIIFSTDNSPLPLALYIRRPRGRSLLLTKPNAGINSAPAPVPGNM